MNKIDVDIDALYSLKGAIDRASNGLTDIGKSIDSYLHDTMNRLQKTVARFQERLNIAQREVDKAQDDLYKAECAYNSCLRSQREKKDEDGHTYYVPSCSFQGARVNLCRKAVQQAEKIRDAWKQKVDAAERIMNDCVREIDRYNDPGGFTHPSGGKGILIYLAEDHSNTASSKLEDTINAVQGILSFSFETGESTCTSVPDVMYEMQNTENVEDEVYDSKREKFEEGKRRVEELMNEKYGNATQPNIYEICPRCGKFKNINCICGRGQHERER